ncbi:hypothetical protein BTUL_0174g00250 [Botrytis tulipae]|uniref:Uncharacterized protein n=1 Tax=Botrytis tulipae TaxID=87230 RepID=A0A4Z1EEW3_9HELO|nr:hypothetical protein BTUL_0174g00250 [Botrytis tulipae]
MSINDKLAAPPTDSFSWPYRSGFNLAAHIDCNIVIKTGFFRRQAVFKRTRSWLSEAHKTPELQQTCQRPKTNHGTTGLKAHVNSFREAVDNLQMKLTALADKLEKIRKLTAQKERRMDSLNLLMNDCGGKKDDVKKDWKKWVAKEIDEENKKKVPERRAEQIDRRARIRSSLRGNPYKGHWYKWSDQDVYFLEKCDTKGFKFEDILLGDKGLQGQLQSSLENIEWHETREKDLPLINREKDLIAQEVGTIRQR